jgi:hypothetical protein
MSIWKVKTDGLNVRNAPTVSDGNILSSLPLGQTVEVTAGDTEQKWWKIRTVIAGEMTDGFVSSKYLRRPVDAQVELLMGKAVQEWLRFKRGDGKENVPPYSQYVGEYWNAIGLDLDGKDRDQAWSAAFISYIVRKAGYGSSFPYSAAHSRYIDSAIEKREGHQPSAFWGYRLNEWKPQLGDLVCKWRESPVTFNNRPHGGYKSHCDLVVEVRDNEVRALGGNVSDSVTLSVFPLDNGFLKSGEEIFAVLRNMSGAEPVSIPEAGMIVGTPASTPPNVSTSSLNLYKAELQKARDKGWFPLFKTAAQRHQLELAYLLAIASRETNMRNMLGDAEHGVGLMQIDIRFHDIARQAKQSGSWSTNPGPLIDYGANLLAQNIKWANEKWGDLGGTDGRGWLKIAASAYNAGRGGATRGVLRGNSDQYTTGQDYGRDVLQRMDIFAYLLTA